MDETIKVWKTIETLTLTDGYEAALELCEDGEPVSGLRVRISNEATAASVVVKDMPFRDATSARSVWRTWREIGKAKSVTYS